MAGPLGVTHCLVLSQTKQAINLRVARFPRGPSIVFRVLAYSLAADVVAAQRHPADAEEAFKSPPLVVLNGFTGASLAVLPRSGFATVATAPPTAAASAALASGRLADGSEASSSSAASASGSSSADAPAAPMTDEHKRAIEMTALMLQHMFPPINVATVRLRECRRVALFSRDPETGIIDLRHYVVRARPAGISRRCVNRCLHTHTLWLALLTCLLCE